MLRFRSAALGALIAHITGGHVAADGEANATVELTPNMAGPAFDAISAFLDNGTAPPKWIQTESKLYTAQDDPMAVYEAKKNLGY